MAKTPSFAPLPESERRCPSSIPGLLARQRVWIFFMETAGISPLGPCRPRPKAKWTRESGQGSFSPLDEPLLSGRGVRGAGLEELIARRRGRRRRGVLAWRGGGEV